MIKSTITLEERNKFTFARSAAGVALHDGKADFAASTASLISLSSESGS